MRNLVCLTVLLFVCVAPHCIRAEDAPAKVSVADGVRPFLELLNGTRSRFELIGAATFLIDNKPQSVDFRLTRFDRATFDLVLTHADYAVELRRRHKSTTLLLPKHNVAIVGTGETTTDEYSLTPRSLVGWLVSRDSDLATGVQLASTVTPEAVEGALGLAAERLKAIQIPGTLRYALTEESPIQFPKTGAVTFRDKQTSFQLNVSTYCSAPNDEVLGFERIEIPRRELERTLVRGVHRATEILRPGATLQKPAEESRQVPHGELRWIGGQRVAILEGTPEQIGEAHGELLKREAMRCIESVLYTFGTVQAIRTGRWFRKDLESAYTRLAPHIPQRHKNETQALAAAINLPDETAAALNVFPELFHCSGFAVFDSATKDGKLYHGRVLDYMTTIGLQDAATTFVIKPTGHLAFANIGYAGFIGSVSGMNAKAISLGEMGGKGESEWDGVPMATLMRRALEECSTLAEVKKLWTESARTCEYYYVFADGKTNEAVGCAATPKSIEFIAPGQTHERLGPGIKDAVVLSAGSRLEKLRERVLEKHGGIDAEVGKWLMSRPVAMQSNLHNVLFVPQDGIFYVANASHSGPAAEQPYVKLNLLELLSSVPNAAPRTAASR